VVRKRCLEETPYKQDEEVAKTRKRGIFQAKERICESKKECGSFKELKVLHSDRL
jgi:endonuclease YncB( thermonuclease family)